MERPAHPYLVLLAVPEVPDGANEALHRVFFGPLSGLSFFIEEHVGDLRIDLVQYHRSAKMLDMGRPFSLFVEDLNLFRVFFGPLSQIKGPVFFPVHFYEKERRNGIFHLLADQKVGAWKRLDLHFGDPFASERLMDRDFLD